MATLIDNKIRDFAQYFEQKFKADLQRRGIIDTSDLQRSFRTEVKQSGTDYQIIVYFNQYGRILDQFSYRKGFKYFEDSKILKKRTKYRWWTNEFNKTFTAFIEEMTVEYADEVLSKFFQALDFSDSVFK